MNFKFKDCYCINKKKIYKFNRGDFYPNDGSDDEAGINKCDVNFTWNLGNNREKIKIESNSKRRVSFSEILKKFRKVL